MKNNISYLINGVLAVAVIVLFILFFSKKTNDTNQRSVILGTSDSTVAVLPIAFVRVDSLLANYDFYKVANERLMSKLESTKNTLAGKERQLQKEAADFQRKVQINAFLSQEKYEQEGQRIQKMQMELEQMAQRLNNELEREGMKVHQEVADSVQLCVDLFNTKSNYEIILSSQGMNNVLVAKDVYDVTDKVLKLMNTRYKSAQGK